MSRRVRVMHVVDNLGKGGLENGLANLISGLSPDRFEHIIYVMRHLGMTVDRLPRDRVRIVHLNKTADSRFQMRAMVSAIRDAKPDIVHSRNWATIEAVMAARIARVRGVVHGEHGLDTSEGTRTPWKRLWFRRLSYMLADRVLCVSHQLARHHSGQTGFPRRRFTVVHNGVDRNRFRPDAAARGRVRSEMGFRDDEFCIICVGNFTPVKDHATLLRAVRELDQHSQRWRLALYGWGPGEADLREFVGQHAGLRERVIFAGLSEHLSEILNGFDACAVTSVTEGICNSLLEAMSCGLPPVVTETGGNPEVVDSSDCGLVFPVGDAPALAGHLLALLADKDLRQTLGARARQRVCDYFSLEAMVQGYREVYEAVLRPHSDSAPAEAKLLQREQS